MEPDVLEAVTARYYAGWRPSQDVAQMWEMAVWTGPVPDDPEREPMTADEVAFLVANDAQFKTEE